MDRIVVAGASLAGLRAGEALRRAGFAGRLTIVGAELHEPYDRPPLSKAFLTGAGEVESIRLRQTPALDVEWILGRRLESLDDKRHVVRLSGGTTVSYDGLVIATGARPRQLAAIPSSTSGVHTLRTADDAMRLRADLATARRVVIVGGGFIGSELASTCRTLGLDVTVITPRPLMFAQLRSLAVAATARARRHGVRVIDTAAVVGHEGGQCVTGVRLSDGSVVPADVVVIAIGAVPETGWLEDSGATIADGVVCDETLAVLGLSNAVAAGDVARWPHPALDGGLLRLEHWTNAVEQGAAAARRLLEGSAPTFAPVPSFWSDQFGVRLQGVGLTAGADDIRVVSGDPEQDTFVAEYRRDGVTVAAVVAGSAVSLLPYRRELTLRMGSYQTA